MSATSKQFDLQAFQGKDAGTVNIAATTSSQRVLLDSASPLAYDKVLVHNAGTVLGFIRFGSVTVTATTTTDIPIPAGAWIIMNLPATYVACILSSGTGTFYFTPGHGN